MFEQLLPTSRRLNNLIEGWGAHDLAESLAVPVNPAKIVQGKARRVTVQLFSGILKIEDGKFTLLQE